MGEAKPAMRVQVFEASSPKTSKSMGFGSTVLKKYFVLGSSGLF